jgi:excisionase family DNA binding protein
MQSKEQIDYESEKYFTPEEISNILNLPISSVYRMLREKKLPGMRIGNLWRISKTDLDAFIGSCREVNANA